MVIGDDELDAGKAPFLKLQQKLLPAVVALAVGEFYGKHLAPAFAVDADGDRHRTRVDNVVFAHFLVAGIEH
jgi:hypothetical protein